MVIEIGENLSNMIFGIVCILAMCAVMIAAFRSL